MRSYSFKCSCGYHDKFVEGTDEFKQLEEVGYAQCPLCGTNRWRSSMDWEDDSKCPCGGTKESYMSGWKYCRKCGKRT